MGKKGEGQTEESVSSHELRQVKLGKSNAAGLSRRLAMLDDLKASIWRCCDEIIGVHDCNMDAQQAVQRSAAVAAEGWPSTRAEDSFAQRQCFLHLDTCVLMP